MSCPACQISVRRLPPITINQKLVTNSEGKLQDYRCKRHHLRSYLHKTLTRNFPDEFSQTNTEPYSDLGSLKDAKLKELLKKRPDILESFVLENVGQEVLEKWLIKVTQGTTLASNDQKRQRYSLSRWRFCVHKDKRKLLERLTKEIQENENWNKILYELAEDISKATHANKFTLYLADSSKKNIFQYSPNKDGIFTESVMEGKTIAAYVARTLECITANEILGDDRFPKGTGNEGIEQSVLCHPILRSDGQLIGVLEIIRTLGQPPFSAEDEEITSSYLAWASIGIHYAEISSQFKRLSVVLDFIHQNTRNALLPIKNQDGILSNILTFGKDITQAERCSYFEQDSSELYAKLLETDSGGDEPGTVLQLRNDIRFPSTIGIAGHTASTGKSLNIEDAYKDSRFNRTIDQKTGYTTRSILCTPVTGPDSLHGVIQLLNKKDGAFLESDVKILEILAGQFGMAMQIEKMNSEAAKLKLLQAVWTEIMEYQSRKIVTTRCLADNWKEEYRLPHDFNSFLLNHCQHDSDFQYYFMHMVLDFSEREGIRVDERTLWHFTLTVKSMYRPLEYHNWAHAFSVSHLIYVILRSQEDKMSKLERLSVLISGICHDLDHRGRNNSFMVNTKSALGLLYPTSTMERHHYDVAKRILQRKECNILESLTDEEKEETLQFMEENILATDLACFFVNKSKFENMLSTGSFDWKQKDHSSLFRSILMTACDLCATAKPWPIQKECARKVYHEFYEQGDEERQLGLKVMPMMDRSLGTNMPENQIGFINGIALPCFSLLAAILPSAKPMEDQIKSNRSRWERLSRLEEVESDEEDQEN